MAASLATLADLDWIVSACRQRRRPLIRQAPIFWQPAPDATILHRAFIERLLADGAKAYRTAGAVLVAVPRGSGWFVDDAHVPGGHWATGEGLDLWNALAADCGGCEVRLVCPTYEQDRAEFAQAAGLTVAESRWLVELPSSGGGETGKQLQLPGAEAITVGAPPVYAPPGPILFLPAPTDAGAALPAAIATAPELGCAAIVVNQTSGDDDLADVLAAAGFRRHCDYYTGTIGPLLPADVAVQPLV